MHGAYPFRIGDDIRVSVRASTTTAVRLFARVRYVDGGDDLIEIDITHSAGDRTNEIKLSPDLFEKAGWIEHLTVETPLNDARGRFYMMVAINREPHHFPIAAGYIDIQHVPLGEFENSFDGRGYRAWTQIANDVSGNVVTTQALAASNAFRRLLGVVIKYHCDGNSASRKPRAILRDAVDASGPTGFSMDYDIWTAPESLTLTANEEAVIYAGSTGTVMRNDNGTLNQDQVNSALPFEIVEDDPVDLIISATQGLAGDDYDAFMYIEEWIAP